MYPQMTTIISGEGIMSNDLLATMVLNVLILMVVFRCLYVAALLKIEPHER